MKRNVLAVVAVLLAFTFAAFTTKKQPGMKTTEDYYWYLVDPSNNTTDGGKLNDDQLTKGDMITGHEDCDDTGDPLCLFGSENPSVPDNTSVPTDNDDVLIRQTE